MTTFIVTFLLITDFIFAQENGSFSTDPGINRTKLDLSKQGITTLENYNFSAYPNLEEIDLSDNNITEIKEHTFKNEKLLSIDLSKNRHLLFPEFRTIFVSNIQKLNISDCGITTLPNPAFDGLRNLRILDLSYNPLKRIKNYNTFTIINSLEKVILPVEDKLLIKELCKTFNNITVDIRNESHNIPAVQCANYINYEEPDEPEKPEEPEEPEKSKKPTDDSKPRLEPRANFNDTEEIATTPPTKTDQAPTIAVEWAPETPAIAHKLEPRLDEVNSTTPSEIKPEEIKNTPAIVATSNEITAKPATPQPKPETPNAVKEITAKPAPPQPKPETPNGLNRSEKIQSANSEEPAKVGESTAVSNTGSTILIVLVVLVVVAGLAAFGYKFYKNRTARAESEQIERELKEIVTNKTIRAEAPMDVVEKEPLMNNHLNKENGDVKAVEPATSNRNSGNPYQPTTTTFKPDGRV